MVMRSGPDPRRPALTVVYRRRLGPWWLWCIVVILAGTATYTGYMLTTAKQQLADADANRVALDEQKDRLQSELAKLRADNKAATVLVAELQERLQTLQAGLSAARAAADANKQEADRLKTEADDAKAAFTQVAKLQERLAALKGEAAAARAELDKSREEVEHLKGEAAVAAEAKAALERQIGELETQISEMQHKLESATAAATATTP